MGNSELCQFGSKCKRQAVSHGLCLKDGKNYNLCRRHYQLLSGNRGWQLAIIEEIGTLDEQQIDKKLSELEQTTERKCIVCIHWYNRKECLPCYKEAERPNFQRVQGMSLIRLHYREAHGIKSENKTVEDA
jgi:hypothetical protein